MKWRDHPYKNREPVVEEVVNDQAVEVYERIWGNMREMGVPMAFRTWRNSLPVLFLRNWSPTRLD